MLIVNFSNSSVKNLKNVNVNVKKLGWILKNEIIDMHQY